MFDDKSIEKYGCGRLNAASMLFAAGFRPQSEVTREIVDEISSYCEPDIDGFFTLHESDLAELQKKYAKD